MRITVSLSDEEHSFIKAMAKGSNRSVSSQIRHLALSNIETASYIAFYTKHFSDAKEKAK